MEEILLFGSRARGDFDRYSDYDILIVVKNPVEISEKIVISEEIRDKLSKIHIPIDIIIKSKDEVSYYKDKIGSVVREALKEGIHL